MRSRLLIQGAVALVLCATLLGSGTACARSEDRSDTAISQELRQRISVEPRLASANIEATSRDGRVTLRGVVHTEDARDRAGDIASEVPGVKGVSNQLEVAPPELEQGEEPTPGMP
jgi:osmotically-inducible protein OsmY